MSHHAAVPSTPREKLLNLLAEQSFRLGEFKLPTGVTSVYYFDSRATTLHAEGARLVGRVVMDLIQENRWKPQAIGGLTMGADPIVTAVSMLSAQMCQTRAPARTKTVPTDDLFIHGFLVRKQEKQHGTGQRIGGFRRKMARVVIVGDVCTTGGAPIHAIPAAREFAFNLVWGLCIWEVAKDGGRANT